MAVAADHSFLLTLPNHMKEFEIEMSATTYRTFTVTAESLEEAEELAFEALDNDEEISGAWKDEARIVETKEITE